MDLPAETEKQIHALAKSIPDEDLAPNGRETKPHVTVKYGLHGNDPQAVADLLAGEPPLTVTLGATSFFPNGESGSGDVLKVDVHSPDLERLNRKIADAFPHTDTHPVYQPHATVAFLRPGLGQKYEGDDSLAGHTIVLDKLTFSSDDGTTTQIPLGGARRAAASNAPPSDVAAYISAPDYAKALRATYQQPDGTVLSSRDHPQTAAIPPIGTWRIAGDHGQNGREIEQLVALPVDNIEISEDTGTQKHPDVKRYAEWLIAGRAAPPIDVVQTDKGTLKTLDHRRLLAAKAAGQTTINAWVSRTALVGVHPRGWTYELAQSGVQPISIEPAKPENTIFVDDAKALEKIGAELGTKLSPTTVQVYRGRQVGSVDSGPTWWTESKPLAQDFAASVRGGKKRKAVG